MRILIFLHGTLTMHSAGLGCGRHDRVRQARENHRSIQDFANYVAVDGAVAKVAAWARQGAQIHYLSSHLHPDAVRNDRQVLSRYGFADGPVHFRQKGETYGTVAQRVCPDIIIEDDCESIGGVVEGIHPQLPEDLKARTRSIVVREFGGIDHLPDRLEELQ